MTDEEYRALPLGLKLRAILNGYRPPEPEPPPLPRPRPYLIHDNEKKRQ